MKHIKLFEDWSPNFNRTLQGAYGKAQITNKGFGKTSKAVMDYANRSISKEVFTVELVSGVKLSFTHDPEFILKPIETFIKENGELSKDKTYLTIPILAKTSINAEGVTDDFTKNDKYILLFKDGKIIGYSRKRELSVIGEKAEKWNLRFSDRKNLEDFFAMTIQAILSSPEPGTPVESASTRIKNRRDNLPEFSGMTKEKQDILDLIQKIVLDKDMRQYTM